MISVHNLTFEVADYSPDLPIGSGFKKFRVGTCEGLWCSTATSYGILAITNSQPNNGHFEDVIQWFEMSCKRDQKDFEILEVWNDRLKKHLLTKRGFRKSTGDNVIKRFKDIK